MQRHYQPALPGEGETPFAGSDCEDRFLYIIGPERDSQNLGRGPQRNRSGGTGRGLEGPVPPGTVQAAGLGSPLSEYSEGGETRARQA